MQPDLNSLFPERDPEPRKVMVEWDEDLVTVKVGRYTLGIEANLKIVEAVIDAIEFVTEAHMWGPERDQCVDGLTRTKIEMEGKEW